MNELLPYIKASDFECLRCGKCCDNLIKKHARAQITQGLMLLPEEIKLFSKENIMPCSGRGKNPNHRNFKITSYQLALDKCSHLKNNLCSIYEKRPTMCRAYPFRFIPISPQEKIVKLESGCSWAQKIKKQLPKDWDIVFDRSSEIYKALEKIDNRSVRLRKSRKPRWNYDVIKRKWVKMKIILNIF